MSFVLFRIINNKLINIRYICAVPRHETLLKQKKKKGGKLSKRRKEELSRCETVVFVIYSSLRRDKILVKPSAISLIISYDYTRKRYAPTY